MQLRNPQKTQCLSHLGNERTFTTASTTSGLAILVSPKDLTLKEQILRLRDGLKLKSQSKMKSNIFRDLDKMSCCECAYKYLCVCLCIRPFVASWEIKLSSQLCLSPT